MILLILFAVVYTSYAQNEIDFDNPGNCGTSGTNWKPCIERKVADQVFGSCCERFVPPECRGLCIYETNAIEARVVVGQTVQIFKT
ncbi:hypothetical protein OESDEN_01489 [Oesophagostomum dentatum]|uniref:Uncharacterized protein n=1 Tax=Oesophagostomum dentatum TaxID=61180 RepID=A0A0B1TSX1_OESDE|nr:hypothetical protein OESDEN_01489 [Oesophagostomum dentatum]